MGGEHLAARLEQLVARPNVRLEHALIHECDAEGLGDQDINALLQLHVLDTFVDHGDDVTQVVAAGELLGVYRHPRRLHRVHASSTRLRSEKGEDTCARADVQNRLANKVSAVL